MYSGKRQKFDWVFVLYVGDTFGVLLACCCSTIFNRYLEREGLGDLADMWNTPGALMVYLVMMFYAMKTSGLYSWRTLMALLMSSQRLLITVFFVSGAYVALLYLLGLGQAKLIPVAIVHSLVAFLILADVRFLLRWLMLDVFKLIPLERIAVVGWTPRLSRVLASLQAEIGRFHTIIGYFDAGDPEEISKAKAKGLQSLGGIEQIEEVHDSKYITLLVIDEAGISVNQLKELSAACSRLIINFRLIPSAFDILSRRLTTRVVAGVPLLGIQGVPLDLFHNRLAKRIVDIVGALVGLAISAPIIGICSILINMESPGTPFYRQERLGQGGKSFQIIKLRSMRFDAEKEGPKWAVQDDPRRLRIGAFLRSTNLDETPQFWNVLVGDMSLVGPRPERPMFVEKFSNDIRHYNLRHYCKPGLTSWAAVHGLRGNTSLTDRLDYDLYYLENWSLFLDFKTMVMTLRPPKNAH